MDTYCESRMARCAGLCNRWSGTTFADETMFYLGQVLALGELLNDWGHDVRMEFKRTDNGRFRGFKSITVDGRKLLHDDDHKKGGK